MNYKNDKKELISFVRSALGVGKKENDDYLCIKRITKLVNEEFLDERGKYYIEEKKIDADLTEAFSVLATICNKKNKKCTVCPVTKYCNTFIEAARKNVQEDSSKMIDLFCGAGGLSLGFTQEGFVTSLANDIQDCCVDTYAHNHPETPRNHIVLGDINEVVKNLDELICQEE